MGASSHCLKCRPGTVRQSGGAAAVAKLSEVCQVVDNVDSKSNAGKAISMLLDAQKQIEDKGGPLWKYAKRGYDKATDGLAQMKDASWFYLQEIMGDNGDLQAAV